MVRQYLALYELLNLNSSKFTERGLPSSFFIDVYRDQPLYPDAYEYFSLPAIFVDYSMQGKGKNNPRSVTISLHIVTDELPESSNISPEKETGLNKFVYLTTLQEILEGSRLGRTTPLQFLTETPSIEPVADYHIQSYEFDCHLADMIADQDSIIGYFETLKIFPSLRKII